MDVAVDALYLRPSEQDASYAIVNERVEHPGFKHQFGVRGRVGSGVGCDCWKVWLQYTHYHARVRDHLSGDIVPTRGYRYGILEEFVEEADSMWRLHMGLADLSLGKIWSVSSCVDLIPYAALRYSEIRHKIELDYGGVFSLSMKNKSFGLGPLVGVEALFHVWNCVGLFSRVAADLLYTKMYIHQNQKGVRGPLNVIDEYHQVRPQFEAALGVAFTGCMFYGRLGFELYFFPGQNQLESPGDLALSGATVGLGVQF